MTLTYRLLAPDEVQAKWDSISKLLDRAVAHGRGELDSSDILKLVLDQRMGVLALEEDGEIIAVTAFELISYPQRKVLNFAYTGGRNARGIAANFSKVDDIARTLGADTVSCMCRPSVARFIKRLLPDAEQAYVVMERRVTP